MGKRVWSGIGLVLWPDHPHARGEELDEQTCEECLRGPSPRPWGRADPTGTLFVNGRTIPTPVGKSPCSVASERGGADHPHARGEESVIITIKG